MDDLNAQPSIEHLAQLPIFSKLSPDHIEKLVRGGQVVFTKHRENIFNSGEPATHFGIVLQGAYKLIKLDNKKGEFIVHFAARGDVLAAFIMGRPDAIYPVTAISMGASQFLRIPREVYVQDWLSRPDLILDIQNSITNRMDQLHTNIAMQNVPLAARIALVILRLAAADNESNEMQLPMPLTRKEIAESTGVRVESVIRVMSNWSKMGIIKTDENRITILQPDKLLEYARNQAVSSP